MKFAPHNQHFWGRRGQLSTWIRDKFLRPLRLIKPSKEEQRQHRRVRVSFPALIRKDAQLFMSGRMKDISLGGAFICCWEPLEPKRVFTMNTIGFPQNSPTRITAEVVWSNLSDFSSKPSYRGMGVQFIDISDVERRLISSLVSGQLKTEPIDRSILGERRQNPRTQIQWPIMINTAKGPIPAGLKDLGADGAYIYCEPCPRPRDFISITIAPPNHPSLKITCEVMWADEAPLPGMGVRFVQMSEKDRQFLVTTVSKRLMTNYEPSL